MEQEIRNPYTALGISSTLARRLDDAELFRMAQASYRELARLTHPDLAAQTPENAARFAETTAYFELLRDEPALRKHFRDELIRTQAIESDLALVAGELRLLNETGVDGQQFLQELLHQPSLRQYQVSLAGARFQLEREVLSEVAGTITTQFVSLKVTADGLVSQKVERGQWNTYPSKFILGGLPTWPTLGVDYDKVTRGFRFTYGFKESITRLDPAAERRTHSFDDPALSVTQQKLFRVGARCLSNHGRMDLTDFAEVACLVSQENVASSLANVVTVDLSGDTPVFMVEGRNKFTQSRASTRRSSPEDGAQ